MKKIILIFVFIAVVQQIFAHIQMRQTIDAVNMTVEQCTLDMAKNQNIVCD